MKPTIIFDLDNGYLIYPDGKLYSTKSNKFLTPFVGSKGYMQYRLQDKLGDKYTRRVHRMVAEMYVPNIHGLPTVNHIDGNKSNNHKDNLEWMSVEDNVKHSHQECFTVVSPTGEVVHAKGVYEFARLNGLQGANLCKVLKGKRPHTKGWRLYEYNNIRS